MSNFLILISVVAAAILGVVVDRIIEKYSKIKKKPLPHIIGIIAGVFALVFLAAIPSFDKKSNSSEIIEKLQSSPYEKSYIDLISATPENKAALEGGGDVAYSYTIIYYVPQFNWERLGVEPRIAVTAEKEETIYGETNHVVLKSVPVQTGIETTTEIAGRFKVPNDRNEWGIDIYLTFEDENKSNPRLGDFIIPLTYKITRTDYEEAYLELVSANPDPQTGSPLVVGSEVEFEVTLKYFVSSFEYNQSGFPPFLTFHIVTSHNEYGGETGQFVSEQQAIVGEITYFTFREKIIVPSDRQILEFNFRLNTEPNRVLGKQIVTLEYAIDNK